METTVRPVSPKDLAAFQCRLCGDCCRDLKDQLMLEPLDIYRLGRYLREQGQAVDTEDLYAQFAHAAMLTDGFPVFLMNTTGTDHACVFLCGHRCSIYPARPRACRLYPFSVCPDKAGAKFQYYQCMDAHAGHFSGGEVRIRDWMMQNLSQEDRNFLGKESDYAARLGRCLHHADPAQRKEWLFPILFYRYYNYDLERPFMEQYERNHRELLNHLRSRHRKER